jgi:hypothetical protein
MVSVRVVGTGVKPNAVVTFPDVIPVIYTDESTDPSAFKNCDDVPPLLMIDAAVKLNAPKFTLVVAPVYGTLFNNVLKSVPVNLNDVPDVGSPIKIKSVKAAPVLVSN